MIFVTNGTSQELPSTQQFVYWAGIDWQRAFKIAQIQQTMAMGGAEAAKYQIMVNLLMQTMSTEPMHAFVSRPSGQAIDWCRWAEFCSWFFKHDLANQTVELESIRRGEIYIWYPSFAQWAASEGHWARGCCSTVEKIDNSQFVLGYDFNGVSCKPYGDPASTEPTSQDVAKMQGLMTWIFEEVGYTEGQNFVSSPPTAENLSADFSPSPPPELESPPTLPTTTENEAGLPMGAVLIVGLGLAVLGFVAMSSSKH